MSLPKNKQGFTLIELLVVISILGVLASMVMITFRGGQGSARDSRRQSDLRQYQTALEVYANRSNATYPNNSGNIAEEAHCEDILLLQSCPDDPLGGANHYEYISNGLDYILWTRLERSTGAATQYFVLCSNGSAGRASAEPTSVTCPPLT